MGSVVEPHSARRQLRLSRPCRAVGVYRLISIYDKLVDLEPASRPRWSAPRQNGWRRSSRRWAAACPLLPGYGIKILDGNDLAATERRVEEFRSDPRRGLAGSGVGRARPGPDARHRRGPLRGRPCTNSQLLGRILEIVRAKDVWIDDRNSPRPVSCSGWQPARLSRGSSARQRRCTGNSPGKKRACGRIGTRQGIDDGAVDGIPTP